MKAMFKVLIFTLFLTIVLSDTAVVTYHMYKSTDALTTVACSDGANGIMGWGYKNISALFPYVTAWQSVQWNSPQCGSCVKISWKGKFIYVTVIDRCLMIKSGYSHFDMSQQAFTQLFGQEGINKGTMTANYTLVAPKLCQGNRKPVGLISGIKLQQSQDLTQNNAQNTQTEEFNQETSQQEPNLQDIQYNTNDQPAQNSKENYLNNEQVKPNY